MEPHYDGYKCYECECDETDGIWVHVPTLNDHCDGDVDKYGRHVEQTGVDASNVGNYYGGWPYFIRIGTYNIANLGQNAKHRRKNTEIAKHLKKHGDVWCIQECRYHET
jgi:hypothetical protein